MNKDLDELLEYNNEYMEAQISEEIFGGDYTSAIELKYAKQELERYKNIVDELENRMLLKINRHYNEKQYVVCIADLEELYDKLKELKGE